ncbi:MAG: DUF721 domain-containing protein [Kofleriaceae bacterium]|nr:DUF721 domain-containing protein [Kofleriaceae bacterium]
MTRQPVGRGFATARKPRRERGPPRVKQVQPAADAVAAALAQAGLGAPVREHRLITEWREMVGERVAARTWPDGLKHGVLWVRVASSSWLHELTLLRGRILDGIHAVLGEPRLVEDLRFHLGARKQVDDDDLVARAAAARSAADRRHRRRRRPPPATGAARARIEQDTAAIADDELRALIRKVRIDNDR